MKTPNIQNLCGQRGMVTLIISSVLLIGITLISLGASRIGSLELSLSKSYEEEHNAFNRAESALDAMFPMIENVVDLNKPDGYTWCTKNNDAFEAGTCDFPSGGDAGIEAASGWPDRETFDATTAHQAKIVLDGRQNAPRWLSTTATGTVKFANYSLHSVYDDSDNRGGKSETVVGVMELQF